MSIEIRVILTWVVFTLCGLIVRRLVVKDGLIYDLINIIIITSGFVIILLFIVSIIFTMSTTGSIWGYF